MFRYRIKLDFDAAHYLKGYDGPCSQLHGHTWHVEFYVRVPEPLNVIGIGADFKDLKYKLKTILPDHVLLNDVHAKPTAENLVQVLFQEANGVLTILCGEHSVEKVVLWETEKNGIEVGE